MSSSDLGITPNVPGTGPATDVPEPNTDPYRNEPGAPRIKPDGQIQNDGDDIDDDIEAEDEEVA